MPWMLKLSALSVQEPTRLLHFLSGTGAGLRRLGAEPRLR